MKKTKKWGMAFLLGVVLTFGAMLAGCDADEAIDDFTVASTNSNITYKATQVGGQSDGSKTTTGIKLSFNANVSDLSADDINIDGAVTPGVLSGSGKVWTLALAEVAAQCEATLLINKDGIDEEPQQVQIYKATEGGAQDQSTPATDLKIRFGITATGADGVTATFTELHNLIGSGNFATIIKLGDWIDLPYLQVAGYPVDDDTDGNGKIDIASNTTWGGDHGELLRLIVVGINSFNNINGNNTPHVVFQFQNSPGTRRMEATPTSSNGYLNSGMRAYLNGFLAGLINAGVPDAFLWAPSRRIANKGYRADAVDIIDHKLWLPTYWEMFGPNNGHHTTFETSDNQTSFTEFYSDNAKRIKYTASNQAEAAHYYPAYWLASPYSNSSDAFSGVCNDGTAAFCGATTILGVAPAFCVQ
jgi:hypothetical protein